MSHFYAILDSGRKPITRTGHKTTGMYTHCRGWNVGGKIACSYNRETEKDEISFSLTSGSNSKMTDLDLGTFTIDDLIELSQKRARNGAN